MKRGLAYLNITTARYICFPQLYFIRIPATVCFEFHRLVRTCTTAQAHTYARASGSFASIQWNRETASVRALFAAAAAKKRGTHMIRRQRKCKIHRSRWHPAIGSKNSPRRYCSLARVRAIYISFLNGEVSRFTDTIPCRDAGRGFWIPVKCKDIGLGDRYLRGNRTRKRCLIRKCISISARDTGNPFSSLFFPPPVLVSEFHSLYLSKSRVHTRTHVRARAVGGGLEGSERI